MVDPIQTDIVVVGAGPGGYAAAFYAADKGKKVVMVERENRLGGTCLLRGCIPSKAYLHLAHLISQTRESSKHGITFSEPKIDVKAMRKWKESILDKLSGGIAGLSQGKKVETLYGKGHFEDSNTLRVETSEGQKFVKYEQAIVAVGSSPSMPSVFDLGNKRIMTSDEALELEDLPKDLLVIGAGYIGMEMGIVYATLGCNVVVVEALDRMLAGADPDLVRYVSDFSHKMMKEIRLNTKVSKMSTKGKKIEVTMQSGDQKPVTEKYDKILVCVGRSPNCEDLGLDNTKVSTDQKGFIQVNDKQQTSDPSIYAIGDVVGGAMLAHKAHKEGRIAVDVITGEDVSSSNILVPAVVFTDPELAWCGMTETEAKQKGIDIHVVKFPWTASGRAISFDRPDGLTKLIIEPGTERVLGIGIVGVGAGELISEGVLAIEMGATAEDIAETIHPHPTLSETIMECAESFYGTSTNSLSRKKE